MRDIARQDVMGQVLWYWAPVVLYAGTIFFLSAQSHPEEQLPSFLLKGVSDKVLHAVEYGILSLLCYRAFRWAAGPAVARQAVVLAIVTASSMASRMKCINSLSHSASRAGRIGWPIQSVQSLER